MSLSVDQYLLFMSVVTLIVVTPGPNLFLLLGTVPGNGRVAGLFATLGICAAILSHATLALIGVGAIIATSAILFTAIKTAGAAYLIWMGLKSLLSIRKPGGARGASQRRRSPPVRTRSLRPRLPDQRPEPEASDLLRCSIPAIPVPETARLLPDKRRPRLDARRRRTPVLRLGRTADAAASEASPAPCRIAGSEGLFGNRAGPARGTATCNPGTCLMV